MTLKIGGMTITIPDTGIWWLNLSIGLVVFVGVVWVWIASSEWAARDAEQRGKPGCLIGLLVFFTWPWGLLFWTLARPEGIVRPPRPKGLSFPPKRMPCLEPGCQATAERQGSILGRVTYT